MRVNAIVLSAGQGTRMGSNVPKVLLDVAEKPLILHTLERFERAHEVERVVLVVAEGELPHYRELLGSRFIGKTLSVTLCPGGVRRQDSVKAGLSSLDADCVLVLIHDGARPFVQPDLIDRCVTESSDGHSLCVAVRARNTIKRVTDGVVQETISRALLWEVQTPQVFALSTLCEAYDFADREGIEATDDASLVEYLGKPVRILEGSTTNIKVTYPEDVIFAEALLAAGKV